METVDGTSETVTDVRCDTLYQGDQLVSRSFLIRIVPELIVDTYRRYIYIKCNLAMLKFNIHSFHESVVSLEQKINLFTGKIRIRVKRNERSSE